MSSEEVIIRKIKPLARILAVAEAGVEPHLMGIGPVPAVEKVVSKDNN